jgi:hypothetical protein
MPVDARLLQEMAFDACMPLQANQILSLGEALVALTPCGIAPFLHNPSCASEVCLGTLHLRPANDVGLLSQLTCTRAGTSEWPRAWPSKLTISSHLGHASQPLSK